jgi:hypothetical protein
MKLFILNRALLAGLTLFSAVLVVSPLAAGPQIPPGPWLPPLMEVPMTPDAQRQAMNNVRTRVAWLKNATRTAPNYATGSQGLVWRSFEALRVEFTMFTRSLTPQQQAYGANEVAELAAGLDILQEAFANYEGDVASGRSSAVALRDMCQVLARGADVWLQQFNQDCARLRVGR